MFVIFVDNSLLCVYVHNNVHISITYTQDVINYNINN
jgi:hypothetical protein